MDTDKKAETKKKELKISADKAGANQQKYKNNDLVLNI